MVGEDQTVFQVEFLSGLTGPAMDIRTLVDAVKSGTLYQLINFGPHYVSLSY